MNSRLHSIPRFGMRRCAVPVTIALLWLTPSIAPDCVIFAQETRYPAAIVSGEPEKRTDPVPDSPPPETTGKSQASSISIKSDKEPLKPQKQHPVNCEETRLRFDFHFQPWANVLNWLSKESGLVLQSSLVPEGTFNYRDSREFTPNEAIDLINGVLLTQGYTLIRRGKLLTLVDLDDVLPDVPIKDAAVEELDSCRAFEMAKAVFELGNWDPGDAKAVLGQLVVMPERNLVLLPKTRQVVITAPAGTLRTIRDVIEQRLRSKEERILVEIPLNYARAEEVLKTVRSLLRLDAGENAGNEIRLAADASGRRIFAYGSRQRVAMLQDLAAKLEECARLEAVACPQDSRIASLHVSPDDDIRANRCDTGKSQQPRECLTRRRRANVACWFKAGRLPLLAPIGPRACGSCRR